MAPFTSPACMCSYPMKLTEVSSNILALGSRLASILQLSLHLGSAAALVNRIEHLDFRRQRD